MMRMKFDSHLDYQDEAISAVVDLFNGQEAAKSEFTVYAGAYYTTLYNFESAGSGVGNRLMISEDEILSNLRQVQLRNGIPQSSDLHGSLDFDVEMETGTGKTYVYSKTMLTLNKRYGFTKFIVVVPSLAIKEGVNKSFEMTKEHFSSDFGNYRAFVYDSSKVDSQIREFATCDYVSIMIINIDSFKRSFEDTEDLTKNSNIIHRPNDKLNGLKPIDLIRLTNPIVIIDEPQSVDTTEKASEAISSLNPLCLLRYSATHVKKHNLVYRLDAVDAYEKKLVKGIDVAGFSSADMHNDAYIKLISVDNKSTPITAMIEVDTERGGEVKRKVIKVKCNDDLVSKTKRRVYEGFYVGEIYCKPGNEFIHFTPKDVYLKLEESIGGIGESLLVRQMISKTIQEHLDKELDLNRDGIKVLSLFFLDRVSNYRMPDGSNGPYADIFEEEYVRLIKSPKYDSILNGADPATQAREAHNGYFAVDKKGAFKDSSGSTDADDDVYNMIMREKEKLLSFGDEPANKLRFIFSHSALREGWDNPNVFQICTLNRTKSEVKKRQEIGRGMRLCVNQKGERIHDPFKNQLTIMANESYEEFAAKLQVEYEEDSGIKFGVIEPHTFANITIRSPDGEIQYLGQSKSELIYNHFSNTGYVDSRGKIQDKLKADIAGRSVSIPEEFEEYRESICAVCSKVSGKLIVKNNDDKRKVTLKKEVMPLQFQELWDKIKYRTKYNLHFDSQKLIGQCIEELDDKLEVRPPKMLYVKAKVEIERGGINAVGQIPEVVNNIGVDVRSLPDIVSYLQNRIGLTRKTLISILTGCRKLDDFMVNPQMFMEQASRIIERNVREMARTGITYVRLGDSEYYAQELFESEEIFGYLDKNMVKTNRSLYDYTVYDSEIERDFALSLDRDDHVKLFFKIPPWFRISTPIGAYNPDWAVLMEYDVDKRLYFVFETKGSLENNRPSEQFKIDCGKKHFQALDSDIHYEVATSLRDIVLEDRTCNSHYDA